LTSADDTLPQRACDEQLPDGPSAGHVWHRNELVTDYYRTRQWDLKSGVPLRETLIDLNLAGVADDLIKDGILS